MSARFTRREFLQAGGAFVVTFGVPEIACAQPAAATASVVQKTVDPSNVDGFIAISSDEGPQEKSVVWL